MSYYLEQAEDYAEQAKFIRQANELRDTRFRKLHAEGLLSWQIAERLGMTTSGVCQTHERLKLVPNREER